MRKYQIDCTVDNEGTCLIFSVDYRSPLEFIEEIETELRSTSLCHKVIFDLLLSNGMTSNRYFEALFNGSNIVNIKRCDKVGTKIKEISNSFYQKNPSLLQNSVLVNQQKFLFRSKQILLSK